MQTEKISRREFNKLTGAGFIALATGCVSTLNFLDSIDDVAKIEWDVNPAIPIPNNGCYTGYHTDLVDTMMARHNMRKYWYGIKKDDVKNQINKRYTDIYGFGPAVLSFSDRLVNDDFFPSAIINACGSIRNFLTGNPQ